MQSFRYVHRVCHKVMLSYLSPQRKLAVIIHHHAAVGCFSCLAGIAPKQSNGRFEMAIFESRISRHSPRQADFTLGQERPLARIPPNNPNNLLRAVWVAVAGTSFVVV